MAQKITELTQEQLDMIPAWNEKWIAIGLSTEPINHTRAEQAINNFYDYLKLNRPQFVHCKGPQEAYEMVKEAHDKNLTSSKFLDLTLCGSMEVEWVALYKFYKDVLGVKGIDQIDLMADIVTECGWWTAIDNDSGTFVYLHERPKFIKMDNEDRLHAEDGPAVEYLDGFKVYAWHGVRIPGDWIEHTDQLTPTICLTWENIEQRRAACEIKGWNNVLKELDAQVVDEDPDPTIGTLLSVELPDIGREQFLRVLCGTGREFALPVPPNVRTALDANSWSYGIDPEDFMPEVRT